MEYSSAFCVVWKVSLSEPHMKTCMHTLAHSDWLARTDTHSHRLQANVQERDPEVKVGFPRSMGRLALSVSERQTQSSPICVWFIFLRHLFFFFSQPPRRLLVNWNAQQPGTYASSWDTNGLKSNLSRIWARLHEGPTYRGRQTTGQRVETKKTGKLGVGLVLKKSWIKEV